MLSRLHKTSPVWPVRTASTILETVEVSRLSWTLENQSSSSPPSAPPSGHRANMGRYSFYIAIGLNALTNTNIWATRDSIWIIFISFLCSSTSLGPILCTATHVLWLLCQFPFCRKISIVELYLKCSVMSWIIGESKLIISINQKGYIQEELWLILSPPQ